MQKSLAALFFSVLGCTAAGSAQDGPRVLDAKIHHLGDSQIESWPAGDPKPEGIELEVTFRGKTNPTEHCLVIRHYHVDNSWPILLNGKSIGTLRGGKVLEDHLYLIPPRAIRNGKNTLFFKANKKTDDILIGDIRWIAQSKREYLKLRPVQVRVSDPKGKPLPARITITDAAGKKLVPVYYAESATRAVRNGVVYTSEGEATIELPEGDYRIYASRGMEWGVDEKRIRVGSGPVEELQLRIGREVDTRGFVAGDSHLHTLTFSGHGDASVEERMVTLAGEGVELAISTDHNHHTDYRPYQQKVGVDEHFTSVIGNEVTTSNGHFNAFPFRPGQKRPSHKVKDWVKLVDGIRAAGAKVVILNHPRWPQIRTNSPFGKLHFDLNRISGQRLRGSDFTFDAMELVNATVKAPDPMFNFVDWFALLNHGESIMAVGSSDSHTVGDPVGQGRTYLRSKTDDPAAIDIGEVCDSYRLGHSSVSHGLFAEVWVAEKYAMGSTAPAKTVAEAGRIPVALRIASAAWARPDRVRAFVNGRQVLDRKVETTPGKPTDQTLTFAIDLPRNDAHFICVVTGPGVAGRFWRAKATNNYVLAATNPVFLDVDGDRKYTSPRAQALAMLRAAGLQSNKLVAPLGKVDDAVAVQVLGALHENYLRLARGDTAKQREAFTLVDTLAGQLQGRLRLEEYIATLRRQVATPSKAKQKGKGKSKNKD